MMSLAWRLLAVQLLGVTYPWVNVIPSEPFDRLPSVALGTGRTGKASEGSPPELCYGMVSLAWRLLAA